MKIISTFLSIPKRGNLPIENEDSFFFKDSIIEKGYASFAIADGASEGLFSSKWSKLVTINYVKCNEKNFDLQDFLQYSCDAFTAFEKEYIKNRELRRQSKYSPNKTIDIFGKEINSICQLFITADSIMLICCQRNEEGFCLNKTMPYFK